MGILGDHDVEAVLHYSPLHYLPFIARSRALKSKPALIKAGFGNDHFRSKSKQHDVKRGFEEYVFLTLDKSPRIVKAKLAGGFPHIALLVPALAIEQTGFDLCRYNVAMTRRIRRCDGNGWPESPANGRYYDNRQIPIARTTSDVSAMLEAHLGHTMIEVLVRDGLKLPDDTTVVAFCEHDLTIVRDVLTATGSAWKSLVTEAPGPYPRKSVYVTRVEEFVENVLHDPKWRGNGLEYDKV